MSNFFPAQPLRRVPSRVGRAERQKLRGLGESYLFHSQVRRRHRKMFRVYSPGPSHSEFTVHIQASPHRTAVCALHVGPSLGSCREHIGLHGDCWTQAEAASVPQDSCDMSTHTLPPAGPHPPLDHSPPGAKIQQEAWRPQRNTSNQRRTELLLGISKRVGAGSTPMQEARAAICPVGSSGQCSLPWEPETHKVQSSLLQNPVGYFVPAPTRQTDRQTDRQTHRSEERRVGKECRSRWSPYH